MQPMGSSAKNSSNGFASNGQAHSSTAGVSTRPGPGDHYDIQRCVDEGVLKCENEETREEARRGISAIQSTSVIVNANIPLMALNTTKAGMEGLDVETINKTIMEASEGSKFYEHKKKQQEKIDRKITDIRCQLEKLTPEQIQKAQMEVDKLVEEIEENTDLSRCYVHLDMDAFFASVEMRDDPSLRDVPMAVGSESMLSTSNYVARRFGVRAAMPGFIARKLCPQITIIPCNFKKYEEASKIVEATIKMYDQHLYMCMDEADLDITELIQSDNDHKRCENAWKLVQEMRKKIEAATQLTASAGIAPTRFLAKLCSDIKKPNGQCYLQNTSEGIKTFLSAIPIRKVCGIGNVTEQLLKGLEVHTCKDLWDKRATLSLLFKRATFQNLLGIALGTGSTVFRDLTSDSGGRKSLSCERTFIGTADKTFLENLCKDLCAEIEKDLKSANLCTKTITLKIKTTEYDVKTRARSIMERTDSADKIFDAAWKIFSSYLNEIPDLIIRLMGVRVSSLEPKDSATTQKTMDEFLSSKSVSLTLVDDISCKDDNGIELITMTCPICATQIQGHTVDYTERQMDIHVEECLSRTKVKEVRLELISSASSPKKRKSNNKVANEAKKLRRGGPGLPIDAFFQKL